MIQTGRQIARSETAQKTRKVSRYWRQRFGFAILLASAAFSLVYVSSLTAEPNIETVNSAAGRAVMQDESVYEVAATEFLEASVFNRNKITISTTGLASHMMQQFPELAQVQVGLPLLNHRVSVVLVPAEPILILATANGSYALDAGGTALSTGAQLAKLSELNLPLVTDESSLEVKLRQQALSSSDVLFISTVLAQLDAQNIEVASLSLPAGLRQLDVRLKGEPYYVKFNLARNSSAQQVGTLIAVYDRLKQQGITPGQYIDVRVDGRAYYQ